MFNKTDIDTYVIITTRSKDDISQIPAFTKKKLAKLSYLDNSTEFKDKNVTKEMKQLLSIPLYYNYYKSLLKDNKTLPDSRFELWNLFHKNACKQEYEEKNVPADEALYIYYVCLPMFAAFMESNRVEEITRSQAIRLMAKIRNSAAVQENCQNIINQIENSNNERAQIEFSKISQVMYNSFRNISSFISFDSESIRFKHQDIREYFCTFNSVWFIKSISSAPLLLELIPNFNLKSSVQEFIKEALGFKKMLKGDDEKIKLENAVIKKENDGKYSELFPKSSEVLQSADIEEVQSQIYQNICLCYAAFVFSDHFMIHAYNERQEILKPFCEGLIECRRFLKENPSILSDTMRQCLLEVYTSVIQFYRMEKDYGRCREIYEFCMDISQKCDFYYVRMLNHQKGKVLLYNSQNIINKQDHISDYYNEEEKKSAKDIFNEGKELLERCLPYNMSANILGQLYSAPADWIINNNLLKRDVCKAFKIYEAAYKDLTDPNYLYFRIGTEMVYTFRQFAGLLMRGHIRITSGEPEENKENPLLSEGCYDSSVNYAKEILDHIKGQDAPFVNWLRGAVALYNKDEENARMYFEKEADNYMTKIVKLKKRWYEDRDELINSIKKDINKYRKSEHTTIECEATDSSYRLEDAEMLGYKEK